VTGIGGSGSKGTIFRINTNGDGYQLIHQFAGGATDGDGPGGGLIQSGSTLYGMTHFGGVSNNGVIFKMDTNGSNFLILHSFLGGTNDGSHSFGGTLVQSGATLYGMTSDGGPGDNGVIFRIQTNGTGFEVLHRFSGGDGKWPNTSLILSDSTLFGMTFGGGSNNLGVIFALDLFPKVAISLSDTNLNLSWSTNYPGFTLESTSDLTSGWTAVPGVTGFSATLPFSADRQFYRLRK
jgi:uncharacterized repeat protein (TIGR03803 family)